MKNVSIREYSVARNLDVDESGDLLITGNRVLFGYFISNKNAAAIYVKFYNKATAPTVGTDTPLLTLSIPAASAANQEFLGGIPFSLGIGMGATTAGADADVGAPAASDVIVNVLYK